MRKNREKGAIVVEASISLPIFIFAIFTILSIVDICFIQSKIAVSLNSAAKEISQYSYLYYKFNLDDAQKNAAAGTEEHKVTAEQTIDGLNEIMKSLSDGGSAAQSGDFDNLFSAVKNGAQNAKGLATMYADKLADDPKQFIIGMGKMIGNELGEEGKRVLGEVMARGFMKKNLIISKDDTPDAFLKRYHVVNGMDGLNFDNTTLMAYGGSNEIQLVVCYEVRVVQFLNIDVKFKFKQCAKTSAWGNGISTIKS